MEFRTLSAASNIEIGSKVGPLDLWVNHDAVLKWFSSLKCNMHLCTVMYKKYIDHTQSCTNCILITWELYLHMSSNSHNTHTRLVGSWLELWSSSLVTRSNLKCRLMPYFTVGIDFPPLVLKLLQSYSCRVTGQVLILTQRFRWLKAGYAYVSPL